MNLPVEIYRGAAQWMAELAGHLWQATLFAALVVLLAGTLRRAPARLRYNLYLLAPLKFLLPSAALLVIFDRLGGDVGAWIPVSLAAVFDVQQALAAGLRLFGVSVGGGGGTETVSAFGLWALSAWLGGALVLGLQWQRRLRTFRRQLREGRREVSGPVARRLEVQRRLLGLRRPVRLVISPRVAEPGVWGIRRPVVVLPESMAEDLERDELDAVLLHELVHVERRDNLVGHGLMILRCLLWFHPLMWWLDRRLLAERERACDERVVELAGDPGAYLRGLAKVLRFGLGARWAGASMASGSDLQRRIRRLRQRVQPAVSPLHRGVWLVALGLMVASSLGAGRLCPSAATPVHAQTPRELLEEVPGGDGIDPELMPSRAPWPSRAACVKPPVQTAAKVSADCDGLRRM